MNADSTKDRGGRFRFSLLHLLTFTAITAVWIASILAWQKFNNLTQQKTQLLGLSNRLDVEDPDQLQLATYPRVADDFKTWAVHIPINGAHEIRFAVGEVSEAGLPQSFDKVALEPGRHRITLHSQDSHSDDFHYTVFVDGQSVIDRTMGRDWMPDGWRQANGLNRPNHLSRNDLSIQHLTGRLYTPKQDFGPRNYFNGQVDTWVSSPGYRLWIDQAGRIDEPASPFMGFSTHANYDDIGLRDGLRFHASWGMQYELEITRPASETRNPVLTIVPEFFIGDQVVLSNQSKNFSRWHLRNEPIGKKVLSWRRNPKQTSNNAFLQADVSISGATEPVIEMRWDASRPDDLGLRLAKTPANNKLTRWRLRIADRGNHLWRLMDIDDRQLDVRKSLDDNAQPAISDPLPIKLKNQPDNPYRIAWRTNFTKPLQLLQRGGKKPNAYLGIDLFQGLPLSFGAEIPQTQKPDISIVRSTSSSDTPSVPIPGGPVIAEIQIDLDATSNDWVWLRAEPQ